MLDQEFIDGFKQETGALLSELVAVVEELEMRSSTFPIKAIQEFSQKQDRIMGTVKMFLEMEPNHAGLVRISKISELCKKMGYMAAASKNNRVIPLFAAFWADVVETMQELTNVIESPEKSEKLAKSFSNVLQGRLEWLAKQVQSAAGGASGGAPINSAEVGQNSIDRMLEAAEAAMVKKDAEKAASAKKEAVPAATKEEAPTSGDLGDDLSNMLANLDVDLD